MSNASPTSPASAAAACVGRVRQSALDLGDDFFAPPETLRRRVLAVLCGDSETPAKYRESG